MKVGTEDKKKLIVAGVFGFFALLALYPLYQTLFGGPSTPAPGPAVVVTSSSITTAGGTVTRPPGNIAGQRSAEKVGTASTLLDPTLHMEAMHVTESLVYSGTGRNIFAANSAPVLVAKVEKPKFPARPVAVVLPPPVPTGPPPPPPINLKFFGTATTGDGVRRAFLLNGEDVFLASAGDIVQRRYRVVSIAANSILIEDIPNSNRQTLPLVVN